MPNPEARWLFDSWWVGCERNSDTAQAASPLMFEFRSLRESHGEIIAEVVGSDPDTGEYYWGRVTLASPQSRGTFLRGLRDAGIEEPRPGSFERACKAVVDADRKGSPVEPLIAEPTPEDSSADWVVPGWIPRGQLTIVYGDGGVGKSEFCLALAVAGLTKMPLGHILGMATVKTPWVVSPLTSVLYLDWEMDKRTHARRLYGLCKPLNVDLGDRIQYKRVDRPYADVQGALRGDVARLKADLTICDSYTVACGGEPETADAANRTLVPMGNLPGSKIATGHVSKLAAAMTKGPVPPFGSVQVRNIPKSAIFLSGMDDGSEDGLSRLITYSHTKINVGPEQRPTALRWAWDTQGHVVVTYAAPDPARLSDTAKVIQALRRGAMGNETLSEETGIDRDSLRSVTSRMKKRDIIINLSETPHGKGQKPQWALADRRRDSE